MRVGGGLHLLVGDWRQPQLAENRLDRPRRFLANGNGFRLGHRTQAAVNHQVTLQDVVIIKIFRIEVRAGEHVVVVRHRAVAGENKVGARQHLHQGARGAANIRVGESLVVGGRHFEVEHRGDQVFRQHRPNARRHSAGHADTAHRAVLQPLNPGAFGNEDAARFEVEHRLALRIAHQRFGSGAGGVAHFQPAGGVGRGEERL